jgi:hypothetical protein
MTRDQSFWLAVAALVVLVVWSNWRIGRAAKDDQ